MISLLPLFMGQRVAADPAGVTYLQVGTEIELELGSTLVDLECSAIDIEFEQLPVADEQLMGALVDLEIESE